MDRSDFKRTPIRSALAPSSTISVCPVMNSAPSEHRNPVDAHDGAARWAAIEVMLTIEVDLRNNGLGQVIGNLP